MVEPADIADLVDALDSPDPTRRQTAREHLLAVGSDAVDTLAANLSLVDRDQTAELIRLLADIDDNRALKPLMDFFRSRRDKPGDGSLRKLTLDAILTVAREQDVDRVFDFLVDIHRDPDPAVRARAIEGFGLVAGDRARPLIERGLDDDDPTVRRTAADVRDAVRDDDHQRLGESGLSDAELVHRLRTRAGSQLDYYRAELLERDNAFELARALLKSDDSAPLRAFRLMHEMSDARIRPLARRYAEWTDDSAERAAAIRLLADRIDADANDEEAGTIEAALADDDPYVTLAATEAAGASGIPNLLRRAINTATDPAEEYALTAAKALTRGLTAQHDDLLADLLNALRRVRDRRRQDATAERIKTEAYLLRSIRQIATGEHVDRDLTLVDEILDSLDDAQDHQPLLVTGLTLLNTLIPEPLPEDRRRPPSRLRPLAQLKQHPEAPVRRRASTLFNRIAEPTQ